jgi:5-methylcytosine-specific restriction protein A
MSNGRFAGSDRRARLPADWASLRAKVLQRDGYRCTWILPGGVRCPVAATDVDHAVEKSDDHRLEAMRSLCGEHHRLKTSIVAGRINGTIRKRMAAARWRSPEPHPGLRKESA